MMSNYACYKHVPPFIRCMTTKLHKRVDGSCISGSSIRYPYHNLLNAPSAGASTLSPLLNDNHTNKAIANAMIPPITSNQQHLLFLRKQQHLSPTLMSGNVRLYSNTPISLAIGRRRRQQISGGLGGEDDESTTKTDAVTTNNSASMNVKIEPKVFLSLVTSLFDTVHQSMVPLVPINEVMILTRGESSRAMHEEQERREYEERKRAKKEMKEKNEGSSGRHGNMGNKNNTNDNDDDTEPMSVQSIGDHRIVDGPYLKIELGPIHGQYSFIADVEMNTVLFQSPISGQLIYLYDLNKTNEWINVHDQHNLLGMFVRDIIRQIQGVPKI